MFQTRIHSFYSAQRLTIWNGKRKNKILSSTEKLQNVWKQNKGLSPSLNSNHCWFATRVATETGSIQTFHDKESNQSLCPVPTMWRQSHSPFCTSHGTVPRTLCIYLCHLQFLRGTKPNPLLKCTHRTVTNLKMVRTLNTRITPFKSPPTHHLIASTFVTFQPCYWLIVLMCSPIHHAFAPDSFSGQAGLPAFRQSRFQDYRPHHLGVHYLLKWACFPEPDYTPLALSLFSLHLPHLLKPPASTVGVGPAHIAVKLGRASYLKIARGRHRSSAAHWGTCLYSPHIS